MCIPAQRTIMGNRGFLISVATNKLRFELELRINNDRVCFSVALNETFRDFLLILILLKYNFFKK